ncbi:hypothetical protein CDIK_3889 [Cucumispora dikerogammari]|nr:hypothetical protein CDIK_3889 [Cucumispora dikerogammari]
MLSLSSATSLSNKIAIGMTDDQILKKKGRKSKINTGVISQITAIVQLDNSINQNVIALELLESGVDRSQSFISRTLKKMNYLRKKLSLVPAERNSPRFIDLRQTYCNNLMNIFVEWLVFLDETGFNLHTLVNYGYSPVNTKAYSVVRANKTPNQSLMCAVDINNIIVSDIIFGAYDGDKFKIFIENELLPYFLNNRRSNLIIDNCRFYHRAYVLLLLNHSGIEYRFLLAFSPSLNSIKEFFNSIKAKYKAIRPRPSTLDQVKSIIRSIIENYDVSLRLFFDRMSELLRLGVSRQPFI